MAVTPQDLATIRAEMAAFPPAPRVDPNEPISLDRVFTPLSHRAVLDLGRQLVVGNRGMGKSLWTHALTNPKVRAHAADAYRLPALASAEVVIGFNGSTKLSEVAPSPDAISRALADGFSADEIWRAVLFRAICRVAGDPQDRIFHITLEQLRKIPYLYEEKLSSLDDAFLKAKRYVLILFDALDRLGSDWQQIRKLTTSLMLQALGLTSFRSIRTKIFIRPDQFADASLFQFPDASKLKNEHVDLRWQPRELYGLLLFELGRTPANSALKRVIGSAGAASVLRHSGMSGDSVQEEKLQAVVTAIAGAYMGADKRRGRVYTWVPLHLSDANNECSPRTFITAWQKAAEYLPAPADRAVNHLGLIEGVRRASGARVEELSEDYRWIDRALKSLKGQFVPMEKVELFKVWDGGQVAQSIQHEAATQGWLAPVELAQGIAPSEALLEAMKNIAVMDERANGKINVPDIFRVEAGIKRKGGVAVPRSS